MAKYGYTGENDVYSSQKVVQLEDAVALYEPEDARLLELTTRLGQTRTVENMVYKWLTDEPAPVVIPLTGAYTGGGGTMTFGTTNIKYVENAILRSVEYPGQTFKVTAVNASAGTCTVIGWGCTDNQNLTNGTNMYVTGNTRGDLAGAPSSYADDATLVDNYCSNFAKSVQISDIAEATRIYGPKYRDMMHKKRQIEIKREIEMAYWLSVKAADLGGSTHGDALGTRWSMGGLHSNITTNSFNYNGVAVSEADFAANLPQALEYSKIGDLALIGPSALRTVIARWGHEALFVGPEDKTWGFAPEFWLSPFGRIPFIHEPILDEWTYGTSAPYSWYAYLINTKELKKVIFTGGGLAMLSNRQNPADDQLILDIYRSRHGLEWGRQKMHSILYNWR